MSSKMINVYLFTTYSKQLSYLNGLGRVKIIDLKISLLRTMTLLRQWALRHSDTVLQSRQVEQSPERSEVIPVSEYDWKEEFHKNC